MQPMILVVDGNSALRRALPPWLTSLFPQCRVITARTGTEGIRAARRHAPRLVVIEVRLPAMNGLEAARRIKARTPEAEVVIFTLCDGDAYRAEARQAGACGYALKYRAKTELAPLLKRLIGEAPRRGKAKRGRRG